MAAPLLAFFEARIMANMANRIPAALDASVPCQYVKTL